MRTFKPITSLLVSTTIVAAMFSAGCVRPPMAMKPYAALHSATATPPSARWLSARAVLAHEGFIITTVDMATMSLIAVRETERGVLRDRALVRVGSDDTEVEFRTEMFDAGTWAHAEMTCVSYAYARERALADEMELVATHDPVEGRIEVAERATEPGASERSAR